MGLNIPDLDRQRYDLLMRDALAKLPSFSDGWNDFNTSDPGITILELLAWFTDINSYRFNRINDTHRRAFLKLVGLEPRPNRPASVLLHVKRTSQTRLFEAGRAGAAAEPSRFRTSARQADRKRRDDAGRHETPRERIPFQNRR